ncbi:hypothetical protein CSV86_004610 [Pseudomonas putida CSV86]|uniref:Uncharacterized protein n=1 Tax=Pseudomonas bharatica CSV86 TaxID=1005395 RepID=A0A7K4EA87_9PSED|nr:hypothetical protein [Pseudomonas bharatica]NNJ14576.1 hypothetical protein [Pseudomonas bharatica CSV86]
MGSTSKPDAEALSCAQALANEWIIPDASGEQNLLARLLGLLKAIDTSADGPFKFEMNSTLLDPRIKVTHDLLRKYGVLVDPTSLSNQAIWRLQLRKNYPRVSDGYTLREWSDLVLGDGEQVDFYLPHSPRRNTHLGTVRYLSLGAIQAISEFLGAVQFVTSKQSVAGESDEHALTGDMPVKEEEYSVLREELDAFKNIESPGESILSLLSKEAKGRWSPLVQNCIRDVEQFGGAGSDAELVCCLLDCIDRSRMGVL